MMEFRGRDEGRFAKREELDKLIQLINRQTTVIESLCMLLSDYTERTITLEKAFKKEKKKRQWTKQKTNLIADIVISSEGFDSAVPSESGTGSPPPSPMEPSQDC